jgi:histidinol dehydrogenase
MPEVSFHVLADLSSVSRKALLRRSETDLTGILEKVKPIIEAVRSRGDAALVQFARELDKAEVDQGSLKVTSAEFDAAFGKVDRDVIEAIEFGIGNIRTFHLEQKPEAMWLKEMRPGAYAGDRFTPIRSVALYVPRGKGAFPSVTMMTSVPAVVAGVPEIAIVTPPAPDGTVDAATLVAARLAGVETVYKAGGAQAIAAVAFGTETIRPALKIVGPGSPWVVAAKRLLAGMIDTGLPAGPSEAVIFADDTVKGGLAALDLLIEAEHGPDSSAYLVTHSRRVAEEALAALARSLGAHERAARRVFHCGAHRQVRWHRSHAVCRGKLPLHQRLCTRASGNPVDRSVCASGPHHRSRGNPDGSAYAGIDRQFWTGAQCSAADQPVGTDIRSSLRHGFREEVFHRLCHGIRLSGICQACSDAGAIRRVLVA